MHRTHFRVDLGTRTLEEEASVRQGLSQHTEKGKPHPLLIQAFVFGKKQEKQYPLHLQQTRETLSSLNITSLDIAQHAIT